MSSTTRPGLSSVTELRVHNLSVSLDGFVAGAGQSVEEPLGVGGERLHDWIFSPDATEVDRRFRALGDRDIGATIMGRNMFGPVRGPWRDEEWTGWWGEDPPFHHDVFVLTHHARDSVPMAGGTTFHFVTDGIEAALDRARAAAGDRHVRLGGGASTVRQYLQAGLLDELHVAVVPVLLGSGERLFGELGDALEGWSCAEFAPSRAVAHVRLRRDAGTGSPGTGATGTTAL
jgi:dihydrofolate reductase